LTTPHTAQQWLSAQQAKNKLLNYFIVTEDLDNNPRTPDDVIIVDHRRIPRFVDGYHFRDAQNRNNAAVLYNLYPTRNQARQTKLIMKKAGTTKLFESYLADQARHANQIPTYNTPWVNAYINDTTRNRNGFSER
jgi:hypothetical protein